MAKEDLDLEKQANEPIYGDDWTNTAQDKLEQWKADASRLSKWHDLARAKYTVFRDCLNLPVIALSGLTTVLIGLNSLLGTTETVSFITLTVSGITTFISGVNAFYSPSERVSKHIEATNAYISLVRNIDYTLNISPKKRPDIEVTYIQVTSAFNAIGANAPPVPFSCRK